VTYALYGLTLGFTWFLVLNMALSLAAAAGARHAIRLLARASGAARARWLLALRLVPAAASVVFVVAVFLPSFLRLEPRNFDEAFGITTTTFAVGACVLLAAAVWRGAAALADAWHRTRAWLKPARRIHLPACSVDAYCLPGGPPAMTLVGVIRPKLLVTRQLLDLLSDEELRAAVEHESGHRSSWDNLKRLLIRATPDALSVLPVCRQIEQEWALAAEHAADAHAAHDHACGLALASALLKVARLTGPEAAASLASPLVGGDAIASRVARLIEPAPHMPKSVFRRVGTAAAIIGSTAVLAAGYAPLLKTVHDISEIVVRILP
jgi:Zn-dependent protease with chaperone function